MNNALLRRAIDLRLEFREELDRFFLVAGLGQRTDLLFRRADRGGLDAVTSTAPDRASGLLGR